jgi:hypothetical protein
MVNHPEEKITHNGFSRLFNTASMKIPCTVKSVIRFRNMRISPLNPGIFTQEDFLPADLEMTNMEDRVPENFLQM